MIRVIIKGGVHAFIVNTSFEESAQKCAVWRTFCRNHPTDFQKSHLLFLLFFLSFLYIFLEILFLFFEMLHYYSEQRIQPNYLISIWIIFVLRNRPSNNRCQLKRNSSFKLINLMTVLKEKVDRDSVSVHFYYGAAETRCSDNMSRENSS